MNRCECENSKCNHGEEICNKFTDTPEYIIIGSGWTGHLCNRCRENYQRLNYTIEVKA